VALRGVEIWLADITGVVVRRYICARQQQRDYGAWRVAICTLHRDHVWGGTPTFVRLVARLPMLSLDDNGS
jgi:hypothetical protein